MSFPKLGEDAERDHGKGKVKVNSRDIVTSQTGQDGREVSLKMKSLETLESSGLIPSFHRQSLKPRCSES